MRCVKRLTRPCAVLRMIGELHGVNGPHLNPESLQRKGSGVIAKVPGNDVRLDGENR